MVMQVKEIKGVAVVWHKDAFFHIWMLTIIYVVVLLDIYARPHTGWGVDGTIAARDGK